MKQRGAGCRAQGDVDRDGIAVLGVREFTQLPRDVFEGRVGGEAERHHFVAEDYSQATVGSVIGSNGLHETLHDLAVVLTAKSGEDQSPVDGGVEAKVRRRLDACPDRKALIG
jgi:hypothetical protein